MHDGTLAPLNAGPHGFSEILYAFASTWNNNGSAMGGISVATPYYDSHDRARRCCSGASP